MKVIQTRAFENKVKKLHKNEKLELDKAVNQIINNPGIGQGKVGDLAGIQVFKFKIQSQQYLLAYRFDEIPILLTLLALGSHENFYRDLKNF